MRLLAILLTVLFVGLKLAGIITWGWFLVALPLILYITISIIIFVVAVVFIANNKKF